eukprot:CAMPEP_0180119682 /NCGR_PEP_ID=MMETSP0986-20121125/2117_1 /TAXON_ID=697907 /ORGANISM="non described non described, Strain CCMP2293" /LENGTH=1139 /DNA_ID=CAMNT_0022058709 /DNA_START=62 /DNA_END=3481 /DNA_ORIENTATION=+
MGKEAGKKGKVAVIGAGISGMSSALLLQMDGWDVTLFESEKTFGGHTLTDETIPGVPVDLGFQVFNRTTYGHFEQFLEMLGVDSEESDMSFALSVDGGKLEWGSHNLDTIFAQRSNLASPSFLYMIREVLRFGKEARKVLDDPAYDKMSLGAYLKKHGYSKGFTNNYLLPMCAAVWSVSNKQVLDFDVQVMIRFWVNHHLLDLVDRPLWRVVKDRSRSYVAAVIALLKDARADTPIASVKRTTAGVVVTSVKGTSETFDQVVMATHADVTLKILGGAATAEERRVLEGVPYAENDVFLHRDPALMPRNRKVWASWNCIDFSEPNQSAASDRPVCVSYYLNMLQRLPEGAGVLFVTLNPPTPPAKDKTVRHLKLAHPVFGAASAEAQRSLPSIQGKDRVWYCGAWCGWGFHEDGIKAATEVVKGLGSPIPWDPRTTKPGMSLWQRAVSSSVHRMCKGAIKKGSVRMILPNGSEERYGNPSDGESLSDSERAVRGAQSAPLHSRVKVYDMKMFERLAKDTDIGLGESYMHGEFEPDDLTNFLGVLTQNVASVNSSQGQMGIMNWVGTQLQSLAHMARANTVEGSRANINEHYDLGNDMYKLFLDETWMYSSGVFNSPTDTLYQSQINKLDLIIDKLQLSPECHILEIGCGWGGFAIRAAQRTGCKVTGITISEEQLAYARQKVKTEGLSEQVSIEFCDYRKMQHMEASFDRLVSIEMIEAVGHENLPEYFQIIDKMLKPGGRAVIQAITYKDEYYQGYCRCSDFIRRHIFPGGHLPCMGVMLQATEATCLSVIHVEDIGLHYATTLKLWHENWVAAKDDILALGYTETFYRKWRFYFSYCEAGFEQQFIHNYQIVWSKAPVSLKHTSSLALEPSGLIDSSVMLMIWCFLSGLAAGKYYHTLWAVPIAFLAFGAIAKVVERMSLQGLDQTKRTVFTRSVVSAVFSVVACVLLIFGLLFEKETVSFSDPLHTIPSSTSNALLSIWCGFSVWALFDGVRTRLGLRESAARSGMVVSTIALCCASVCLAKQFLVPYVCLALVGEFHSFFMHLLDLCDQMGRARPAMLERVHLGALAVARIGGHALLTAKVVADRQSFSHFLLFWVAVSGMAILNVLNLKLAVDLAVLAPLAKKLSATDPAKVKAD